MIDKELYEELWDIYKQLGVVAFTLNHYDLAKHTKITSPETWKQFLLVPEVSDWIRTENQIIQQTEISKLANSAATKGSVGQAQLLTALTKLSDGGSVKEGPIFVYTYIPLNQEQENAPNVIKLKEDPFLKGDL